jgi:hypothetical protein
LNDSEVVEARLHIPVQQVQERIRENAQAHLQQRSSLQAQVSKIDLNCEEFLDGRVPVVDGM